MKDNPIIKKELELAEAVLREIKRSHTNDNDLGWLSNQRANLYAVEAEIRRLEGLLK